MAGMRSVGSLNGSRFSGGDCAETRPFSSACGRAFLVLVKVVSEKAEREIATYEAERRLDGSLRALAANMLRVVRGAGRAYEFSGQMADVLDAMQAYRDAAGVWPSDQQLSSALRLREPDYLETLPEHGQDRFYAERSIVRGALQIAASELLGQQTQKAAGRGRVAPGAPGLRARRGSDACGSGARVH
ncbi:hypothetical protein LRS10_09330 [Phenylobacterium sp. J426]|uniref:hypothetical protein n=1 Tax=Phenylobacterium sp. J426 TaxID=2898439 RepID=UPI0021513C79|nr:hypothetical protein [Phenylobacterium sp. J426]MCR5874344.1 hypothetical protein [Phenylobacterium sp. J426]